MNCEKLSKKNARVCRPSTARMFSRELLKKRCLTKYKRLLTSSTDLIRFLTRTETMSNVPKKKQLRNGVPNLSMNLRGKGPLTPMPPQSMTAPPRAQPRTSSKKKPRCCTRLAEMNTCLTYKQAQASFKTKLSQTRLLSKTISRSNF